MNCGVECIVVVVVVFVVVLSFHLIYFYEVYYYNPGPGTKNLSGVNLIDNYFLIDDCFYLENVTDNCQRSLDSIVGRMCM